MTDRQILPFYDAACEVLKLMLELDVSEANEQSAEQNDKLSITIGVTGDYTGQVLYRFSHRTILEMVKIMSGIEIEEIDDFVTSAASEIANIISGKAMTTLSEQKILCDILPPEVFAGSSRQEAQAENAVSTVLATEIGELELEVCLIPART